MCICFFRFCLELAFNIMKTKKNNKSNQTHVKTFIIHILKNILNKKQPHHMSICDLYRLLIVFNINRTRKYNRFRHKIIMNI